MGFRFAMGAVVATAWVSGAAASDLIYQPVSPGFGGDPFNTAYLLGTAEAQNQHIEEQRFGAGTTGLSQADLFVRQLQSRLLSSLAGQVSDAIFGDDAQDQGEIVFGDQTITFERGLEFIEITIFDAVSGSSTDVRVPLLQTGETALSGIGP
jgi:curli production assembly/transport component CsgF